MAEANTQVAMGQINLFLALGGGWEKDEVARKQDTDRAGVKPRHPD
ncbi:hypothetical protein ALQ20_200132 [Pseudomonas syringae pv. atrofaciens]|nr:hypothetical protein ALQ20_200132 [Pseudomonas syringae pv. atrofaciens]